VKEIQPGGFKSLSGKEESIQCLIFEFLRAVKMSNAV
jgi:hypothetical protein